MTTKVPKRRAKQHYVNNHDFYDALVKYRDKRIEAERNGLSEPRIPNYIGQCILLIANKLSNASNFCNYSYKDEMISDGIEDCILRIKSFDPDKSKNPFAYFTQTCYFAFVRRIKKEKKQKTIKSEMIKNSGILDTMDSSVQQSDDGVYDNTYRNFLLENIDIIQTDAEKEQASRKVFKKTTKAYQAKLKALEKEREEQKTIDDFNNQENEVIDITIDDEIESIEDYYNNIED